MNKTLYFPDMRVNESDLNNTEQSRASAIRQQFAFMLAKFSHQYTGSIATIIQQTLADQTPNPFSYRGIGGGFNSDYLLPITGSLSQISIQRGWGITDNADICILTGSITINQGDNDFHRIWGTLTDGQPAYVTAEYQEMSSSVGNDSSGNIYYKRYTGDFLIRVSDTYPSGSNQIPLAQFTANGNLITAGTFQDKREWARPWAMAESTLVKNSPVPSLSTVEQHITAVGTGTPSTTNPHGMVLSDLVSGSILSTVIHKNVGHPAGNEGNRALNTVYQNTASGSMFLSVSIELLTVATAAPHTIEAAIYVDRVDSSFNNNDIIILGHTSLSKDSATTEAYSSYQQLTAIIPPGAWYKVYAATLDGLGSYSIIHWSEQL